MSRVVRLRPGREYEVRCGADQVVTVHEVGTPAGEVVSMTQDDALEIAYALQSVGKGQGPSLVRVVDGKRCRGD